MRLFGKNYRVDWAHLVIVSVMAAASLVYWVSARQVSLETQNLLLLQPTAILIIILYFFIVPQCFTVQADSELVEQSVLRGLIDDAPRVGTLAVALILYATLYETVGFDVASFIFCVVSSFVCGERRLWVLGIFGLASSIFVTFAARFLVSSPIPTMFI